MQSVLPGVPDDRPERDGPFRASGGTEVQTVRLLRRARCGTLGDSDGLGRGRGGRGCGRAAEGWRKGRTAQSAAVPTVLGGNVFASDSGQREVDRGAGSYERAGSAR